MNPADFYPNTEFSNSNAGPEHVEHSPLEERMFGNMAQADRQRVQQQERQAQRQAQQRQPADRQPMTDDERARVMFDDSLVHGDAQRETVNTMTELGWTPEDAQQAFEEAMPIFEAFGATATESATATKVAMSIVRNEPGPELVASWVEASRSAIAQDFGQHRIGEVLAITQAYVNGIPEAADMLRGAMGNHPSIVRILTRKAMDAKRGVR